MHEWPSEWVSYLENAIKNRAERTGPVMQLSAISSRQSSSSASYSFFANFPPFSTPLFLAFPRLPQPAAAALAGLI